MIYRYIEVDKNGEPTKNVTETSSSVIIGCFDTCDPAKQRRVAEFVNNPKAKRVTLRFGDKRVIVEKEY